MLHSKERRRREHIQLEAGAVPASRGLRTSNVARLAGESRPQLEFVNELRTPLCFDSLSSLWSLAKVASQQSG